MIAFEGEGRVKEYVGGYEDWLRQRPASAAASQAARDKADRPNRARLTKVGLGFKESKELEALPARIEQLEIEQRSLTALLADPAVYRDVERSRATRTRFAAIEQELATAYERWEALEARASA